MNTPEPIPPLTDAILGVLDTARRMERSAHAHPRRLLEVSELTFREVMVKPLEALFAAAHPPAAVPAPTHYSGPHDDCIATIAHWHDRPYRVGEWAATFDEGWIAPPATVPDEGPDCGIEGCPSHDPWPLSKSETEQELRERLSLALRKSDLDWPRRPDLAYAELRTAVRALLSTTDDKVGEP